MQRSCQPDRGRTGPTSSFGHDAMPPLQLQLRRPPTVMLTKRKWRWHSEPAKYEGSSQGKGFGKSEHGRSCDGSSMGGGGGSQP